MSEREPDTWQTDALGLLEADPVRPPSEGLARRTRDVARALARSAEPAGTLPVGARVGPYTLGEVLGRGGQATVYRATDDEGRPFAVKVPRPELVSRLAREAQILFHLDHPRIVRIERADMKADPPFIACRLLEGGTLAERLRKGPMSPPDVACLADQILEALIHGHEKGVVHRDLKPSNVLFDRQHDAQVADFGVGSLRLVEEHALGQTLVSVDVTRGAGTPLYMAPEQEQVALRVDGKVDGRADLYALGKLLYEALTGRSPRTIRPASQVVPRLDPRWDAFLFRLVEDRPQDRFADAAAAREALHDLLPGRGAPARADEVGVQKLGTGRALLDKPPGGFRQVKVYRPSEGWASLGDALRHAKGHVADDVLRRLEAERAALDEKAAATEEAYRNLEAKLGEVNQQFQTREHRLWLEREALEGDRAKRFAALARPLVVLGLLPAQIVDMLALKAEADLGLSRERVQELVEALARERDPRPPPGAWSAPSSPPPRSDAERREALREAIERNLRSGAPGVPPLEAVERALDAVQTAARGSSAALFDDEGRAITQVGLSSFTPDTYAALVAAACAATAEVAKASDGAPEFELHVLESRSTVLTIARIAPGLRVAVLAAAVPPRGLLRHALVGLAQTLRPEEAEPLRGLALVRRAPEEPTAFTRPASLAARAWPVVVAGGLSISFGILIGGSHVEPKLLWMVGLIAGLLPGVCLGALLARLARPL